MKEEDMITLRQQDRNLQDALRQEEAAQPQMPADLNARLMQRVEDEQPKQHRTVWRWMAAAACLLLIITDRLLLPSNATPYESASAARHPHAA